ncbi:MAG TPA: ATP-binding protein [Coriobacteriia bacterium]|nr:ATP-binding protein [Coriobacteriia bacterium]
MTRIAHIVGSATARLLAGFALVAAVFAAAWLWSLYGPLTDAVANQQLANMTAVAHSAAMVVATPSDSLLESTRAVVNGSDLRLTIVAADGKVLADSEVDPKTMENHADRPEVQAALQGQTGTDRRNSKTEGTEQLYVAVPGAVNGEKVAVRVSQSLDQIKAIAARLRRVGLGLLALALASAFVIAWPATRAAARPVEELSQAASRMADGNLSVRIPEVPTDLAGLAHALTTLKSQMRSRLEALDAERRSLRAALDGLTDVVLVLDGDVIQLANRAADRLFRAPAAGWEGASLEAAGLPAPVASAIRGSLRATSVTTLELEPDPTGRALRLTIAPLDPGGIDGRTIAVVADYTERARLDSVRRDFVANASHELKTPVSGIKLLAESAATAAEDGDDAQAIAFARQIAAETVRLQRLVTDLLDLSRLETPPAPDSLTDLRAAVENAVVGHRAAAERKGLNLLVDVDAVEGANVFAAADPTDVAVALDNLLDNAITYTATGRVSLRLAALPDVVEIAVSDTGPGIASEHLARVFERFYRVDRGRSRDAGGTGLGLALVRHVVERNGGSIALDSRVGFGSTFTIRLPRAS